MKDVDTVLQNRFHLTRKNHLDKITRPKYDILKGFGKSLSIVLNRKILRAISSVG